MHGKFFQLAASKGLAPIGLGIRQYVRGFQMSGLSNILPLFTLGLLWKFYTDQRIPLLRAMSAIFSIVLGTSMTVSLHKRQEKHVDFLNINSVPPPQKNLKPKFCVSREDG